MNCIVCKFKKIPDYDKHNWECAELYTDVMTALVDNIYSIIMADVKANYGVFLSTFNCENCANLKFLKSKMISKLMSTIIKNDDLVKFLPNLIVCCENDMGYDFIENNLSKINSNDDLSELLAETMVKSRGTYTKKIVEKLLILGADPNYKNKCCAVPSIHIYAMLGGKRENSEEIMDLLIEYGGDIKANCDDVLLSPLCMACRRLEHDDCALDMIKYLIKNDCTISTKFLVSIAPKNFLAQLIDIIYVDKIKKLEEAFQFIPGNDGMLAAKKEFEECANSISKSTE